MAVTLLIFLVPIFSRGATAVFFSGTIEFREMILEKFGRGDQEEIETQLAEAQNARQPVYAMMEAFESELEEMGFVERQKYQSNYQQLKAAVHELLGPKPDEPTPVIPRHQYGQTRWNRAHVKLEHVLYRTEYDYSDPTKMGVEVLVPRQQDFQGTALENLFPYIEMHLEDMLLPQFTVYWRFFFDTSIDSHFFGGIWAELLGTLYLAIGSMMFAVPLGIIAAIYLAEYARQGMLISLIRICISTLAGVPSIVFGLFGLAFFINTIHVSQSKSVLAGSLTLALLVLPTIIRASEEAILAVPKSYKEASMALGMTKWKTVLSVILPAAIPGIITGNIISLGRAAGETAPIIFTAAVSLGPALGLTEVFSQPTPALPWNVYNLCTEHEAVDEIRHVQYGMVATLIGLVLLLNLAAIIMRARITKKLRG
jgi:phosphate transport system permease protein